MRYLLLILALIPLCASSAPHEISIQQKNAADTSWITRIIPPPTADGLFMFRFSTKIPVFVRIGDGLVIDGSELKSAVPEGPTGPQGPEGPAGPPGDKGDTGDQGPQGIEGPSGIDGEIGPQGIQGIQGPIGNTGPAGADGVAQVGSPESRTVALSTAYQCTNTARPCVVMISLQAMSSISLAGASNNEGAVYLGSTSAVSSGVGSAVGAYKNNLGGGLVIGLNLTMQTAKTYTVNVPAGWYFSVRQTSGTGLQVVSAFEQAL